MIKEIEKTIIENADSAIEMTHHCIKIDLESNTAQVDYPKTANIVVAKNVDY